MSQRIVLFCEKPYALSILQPLAQEAERRGCTCLWYLHPPLAAAGVADGIRATDNLADLMAFDPQAILVPGNEVPYYLPGVKVQVFHGFAGEKKGHFRIRDYFDLYLTQGPYFTERFSQLSRRHGDFAVQETGWPRLDHLFDGSLDSTAARAQLGLQPNQSVLLYAPTFSPRLTSVPDLLPRLPELAAALEMQVVVKFHPLMDARWVDQCRDLAAGHVSVLLASDADVSPCLLTADLLLSDTSSVVYEALLLDKPVVTWKTTAEAPIWPDVSEPEALLPVLKQTLTSGPPEPNTVKERYHPYTDGQSSARMLDAVANYIERHGVPKQRQLGFWRRRRVHKTFGPPPC